MTICEEEANVVRRVFEAYGSGHTPRQIAAALNADRVRPPRGKRWMASTINGSRLRGNGILHNELYVGRLVWNRLCMIKDPDTGKRVSRLNPREKWHVVETPAWKLVDEAGWQAVQARTAGRAQPSNSYRRPKRLLSGLLRCGSCGAGMSICDRTRGYARVKCSRYKEAGDCKHKRTYQLGAIEVRVLDGLTTRLRNPRLIAEYVPVGHAPLGS